MIPQIHQGTPPETRGLRFVFEAGCLDMSLCLGMSESKNGTNSKTMICIRVSEDLVASELTEEM